MSATAPRGRRVVITGAAGGIGRAVARRWHAAGAELLVVDADAGGLSALCDELGARAHALPLDIAATDAPAEVLRQADESLGGADVLVSGAGIERIAVYDSMDAGEVRRAMEVNLLAAMLLTHALLPGMRARRRGHIVTIASMAGLKPVPHNVTYNAAKAGLIGFSLGLRKDLAGTGVSASVVCPSAVSDAGMWARYSAELPRNRLVEGSTVTTDDVAAAVLRAVAEDRARVLVASPVVRGGAVLSLLSPAIDVWTDRLSGIRRLYRRRVELDRDRRLR